MGQGGVLRTLRLASKVWVGGGRRVGKVIS